MIAKLSNGKITAMDNHQSFLGQLKRNAEKEGVAKIISLVNCGMTN